MKRLIVVLLLMAIPCFAAPTWRITVKIERPGSEHADSMRVHHAKHDSVQIDFQAILNPTKLVWVVVDNDEGPPDSIPTYVLVNPVNLGWAIIDNASGTAFVVTAPDTVPIIGPIRSALGKYNQYATVRKVKVEVP